MKTVKPQFNPEWVPSEDQIVLNSPEFQAWYAVAPDGTRGMNLNNNCQRQAILSTFKQSLTPPKDGMTEKEIRSAIAFAGELARLGMGESYKDFAADRKW